MTRFVIRANCLSLSANNPGERNMHISVMQTQIFIWHAYDYDANAQNVKKLDLLDDIAETKVRNICFVF